MNTLKNKQQVNNQVSQNASLPHMAFALQTGKTTGYVILRLRKSHVCKIPDALTTAQGHQFYLLSPEAVRLTDVHKITYC